jgi:hypothetical protein
MRDVSGGLVDLEDGKRGARAASRTAAAVAACVRLARMTWWFSHGDEESWWSKLGAMGCAKAVEGRVRSRGWFTGFFAAFRGCHLTLSSYVSTCAVKRVGERQGL